MRKRLRLERWQLTMWSTVVAEIMTMVAFNAAAILIPYYIQDMGITDPTAVAAWTGAYQSAGGITFAIFTPIWGAVGDRYGRKLMLVRAFAATAVILFLMSLARTPTQLMVLRVIQGCVTGTPGAASALLATNAPRNRIAFSLGLLQTSMWIGASLGPMLGGIIADTVGYRASFAVSASLTTAALFVVLLFVREPEGSEESAAQARRQSALAGFRDLLTSRSLVTIMAISLAISVTLNMLLPVLPLFVQSMVADKSRLATTAGTVSGFAAFTSAMAALVVGRWSDKVGHRTALLVCAAGMGLLMFPMAAANGVWMLGILLAMQGFFRGGYGPNISAMVVQHAPSDKTGSALGLSSSASTAGFALGPLLGAGLLALTGMRTVYVVAGVAMLALVPLLWRRRGNSQEPTTAAKPTTAAEPTTAPASD